MEISISHEQQATSNHGLEELLIAFPPPPPSPEKKQKLQPEQALKCPRCDSTNTKFCYYNNYSLSQPRYFCKSCRRYWTKGGSLRNVPVGGGCRKNRRSSSSSSPSSSINSIIPSSKPPQDDQTSFISTNHDDQSFAFATQLWPSVVDHEHFFLGNPNSNPNPNPNPNSGSIGGFLNFSSMNGFHQMCHGNNGSTLKEEVEESNQNSTERSCKVLMDLQMQNGVDGGLGLMEYSSWHGLINSFLV